MSFDSEFFAESFDRGVDMRGGYQRTEIFKIDNLPAQLLDELSGSFFLAQFSGLRRVSEDLTRVLKTSDQGLRPTLSVGSAYR